MEKEVRIEENLVEMRERKGENREKEGAWRNLKIRKETYEQVKRLSRILDIKKYKVIDLSILILSILMSEKIVINQEDLPDELMECKLKYGYNEGRDYAWAELDPVCVLKKVVLPFYRKRKVLENLMRNIESLSKI